MAEIIGLLPMGGRGTRLGLPFPKPLAPTITSTGIVPLYRHTLIEIRKVTNTVFAIVTAGTDTCLLNALAEEGVRPLWTDYSDLPGALGDIGSVLASEFGPDALVVTALPDSIWRCRRGASLQNVLDVRRSDGALALFWATANQLDEVVVEGDRVTEVITKGTDASRSVRGWGAFAIRAGALATFTDAEKDGPQLGHLDMGWSVLGEYIDLGTPERYITWHDTRLWDD